MAPVLPGSYILKCLLSPDVRQLATTSSDKTIKLWNLDGFSLDRTLTGGQSWRLIACSHAACSRVWVTPRRVLESWLAASDRPAVGAAHG